METTIVYWGLGVHARGRPGAQDPASLQEDPASCALVCSKFGKTRGSYNHKVGAPSKDNASDELNRVIRGSRLPHFGACQSKTSWELSP